MVRHLNILGTLILTLVVSGTVAAAEIDRFQIGGLTYEVPIQDSHCVVSNADLADSRFADMAVGPAGRVLRLLHMHMQCDLYHDLRAGADHPGGSIIAWFQLRTGQAGDRLTDDQRFQFDLVRSVAAAPPDSEMRKVFLDRIAAPFRAAEGQRLRCADLAAGAASVGGLLCVETGSTGSIRDLAISAALEPLSGVLMGALVVQVNQPDAPPPTFAEADALLDPIRKGAIQ